MLFCKKTLIISLILSLLIVFSFNAFAEHKYILSFETNEDNIVVTTENAKLYINKGYITKDKSYLIAKKIEKGIRDLKSYLGKYSKYNFKKAGKIEYIIKDHNKIHSNANRGNGRIYLSHVHLQKSPYIHETAHILLEGRTEEAPDYWLAEGLPTYLNTKLAQYPSDIIKNNNNLEVRTQEYFENEDYKVIIEYFPKPFFKGIKGQRAYYTFAGSFIKFIENKYGKEKLLKLYNVKRKEIFTISDLEDTNNEDNRKTIKSTKDILNTSIEELKNEWLDSLQT